MQIDITEKKANLIILKDARVKFRPNKCSHNTIIVDEELNTVECEDCKEKLNPIQILVRFAREETRWNNSLEEMRKMKAVLDERKRFKCKHCEKITTI